MLALNFPLIWIGLVALSWWVKSTCVFGPEIHLTPKHLKSVCQPAAPLKNSQISGLTQHIHIMPIPLHQTTVSFWIIAEQHLNVQSENILAVGHHYRDDRHAKAELLSFGSWSPIDVYPFGKYIVKYAMVIIEFSWLCFWGSTCRSYWCVFRYGRKSWYRRFCEIVKNWPFRL